MCRLIAYKNKQMRNKGSYHVWSILQKFRGFKLICKYYFMHKEKKANIIIETSGGQSTQIKYLIKSTDTYNKILLQ